jgi:cation transport ATPase
VVKGLSDKLPDRLPDEELDEIMELLGTPDGLTDETDFTYEDILADETLNDLEKRTRKMRDMAKDAEALRPAKPEKKAEDSEVVTTEFSFSPEFKEHLAPSGEYMNEEEENPFPEPEEKPNFFAELLAKLRRQEAAPVLTPAEAQPAARAYAVNLRLRAVLALALTIPLIVISCFQSRDFLPDFLSYLEKPYLTLFFMVLLQTLVMLCGIDVLGRGISDLIRLKPGAETLVVLSCFASLLHVGSIVLRSENEHSILYETVGFLPFSAISAGTVAFALWGYAHRYAGYARTYKTADVLGDKCDCVISEEKLWGGESGFARHITVPEDFVAQTEAPDIVSRVMRFVTPLLIIAAIVLAALSASYHDHGQYFFWAFSAFCSVAVPLTTFCSYPFVYSRITARLSHMGSALMGWTGAVEAARGDVIIIEDGDLFPSGTLALNGLKVRGDHSFESVLTFSASLLHASGSGLYKALEQAVKDRSGNLRPVTGLEMFEGGLSGNIGNDRVMMGTLNFMHSMGIQVPPELSSKSAVFTSVNHDLACVLAVSHTPATQVKGALMLLESQKMSNILAVRDINITPTLLREKFGVNPDMLEWPVIETRAQLSDPARPYHGKVTAVLAKDGLCPYVEAVIGGKRLHRFTLINLCIHIISLIAGMFIVFYFTSRTHPVEAASISPGNLLLFMFAVWVTQWLVSCFSHRY